MPIKRRSKSPPNKKHKSPSQANKNLTPSIMSSTYYSDVDHPHPYDPNWVPGQNTPSPTHSHSTIVTKTAPHSTTHPLSLNANHHNPSLKSHPPLKSFASNKVKGHKLTTPTDHPISHIPPSSPNKSKSTTQTLTISLGYSTTLSTPSTQLHPTIPRDLPLMSLGKSPPFHPPKQSPDQSMPSPRKVTHPWRTPSSFVKF